MPPKQIERTEFGLVLTEWGQHECSGRLREHLGGQVPAPQEALQILLETRAPIVAKILSAEPIEAWRVELDPADLSEFYTLEHPLERHSRAMVEAAGSGGEHVRNLVAKGIIEGPILATAQLGERALYFVDGLHRVWAWAELARTGQAKPIRVSLVLTRDASWWSLNRT
jgi:hypothetical protein